MADNTDILDGNQVARVVATDELSDLSQSPKVTLLDGTGSPTPISPATSGNQTALNALMGGSSNTARMPSAAASTNATRVKAAAGRIYQLAGKNNAAYDVFLVIYDSAVDPPVPGTTAIRMKLVAPAGQGFVYDFALGLYCGTGIGYAFTKLVADADTTVLVAADVTAFNLSYA